MDEKRNLDRRKVSKEFCVLAALAALAKMKRKKMRLPVGPRILPLILSGTGRGMMKWGVVQIFLLIKVFPCQTDDNH